MSGYTIREASEGEHGGFSPRGGALKLWKCKDPEVMLSGPSETGKTYSCLQKLDALCWKYPGSQAVIIRKVLSSIYGTALNTYRKVLGPDTKVTFYGGEKPQWADYPNGSRVYLAGMDNPQKALSSERDFIYVNQAEELTLNDWETLTTRATGRAGNAPYAQVIGDCNPGAPSHWIKHRPSLTFFESRHEDNPTLFDDAGQITEQGKRSLAVLDRLTGVRKDRLRYGRWVQAEGSIYPEFDRARHVIEPFAIPQSWRRVRAIDFGYTNPFVCQWWALDGDGRMFLYREIYMTKRTVKVHSEQIERLSGTERYDYTIADHDAEDRATLAENDIPTIPAVKDFSPGMQAVEERLKVQGDGKPRLFIFADALVERDEELYEAKRPTCTAEEFESYIWERGLDGRPSKERPVKENDHGMDAMRYLSMFEDKPTRLHTIAGAVAVQRPAPRPYNGMGPRESPEQAVSKWNRTGEHDDKNPNNVANLIREQRQQWRHDFRRRHYGC
jgi:phage terminase large subunit